MPFFVYAAILITAVFSVALEWDALVVPSGILRQDMEAVSAIGKPIALPGPLPITPAAAPPVRSTEKSAAKAPAEADAAQKAAAPAPPSCDVAACAAAYHSFRASDCTYQPFEGARRLCTRGTASRPGAAISVADEARAEAPANAPACNVQACQSAYASFDAGDCTYQPFNGPRRLCSR